MECIISQTSITLVALEFKKNIQDAETFEHWDIVLIKLTTFDALETECHIFTCLFV